MSLLIQWFWGTTWCQTCRQQPDALAHSISFDDPLMSMMISEILKSGEGPCKFSDFWRQANLWYATFWRMSLLTQMDFGDMIMSNVMEIDERPCQFHDLWWRGDANHDIWDAAIWRMPLPIQWLLLTRWCPRCSNLTGVFANSMIFGDMIMSKVPEIDTCPC